jgi:hypothetical protein
MMSSQRIRELLKQLRDELESTPVDPETLSLMRELDADIHDTLAASPGAADGLLDRARAVEVRFAVEHGVAERLLREIIDTLAKIGV